jgi:hypothetical protein
MLLFLSPFPKFDFKTEGRSSLNALFFVERYGIAILMMPDTASAMS